MKYIANIITKHKIEISSFFNVSTEIKDVDTSIPTLIIGWEKVKKLFPNQDILNDKISDTISWTFSKREKRHQYEKDIHNFIQNVILGLNDLINYRFFNYVLANPDKREQFISYITNKECSIYYNSRFMYVYVVNDNLTLGISLRDLEYIGISNKEFISKISKTHNIMCDNLNCIDVQSFSLIKDNIKVIAYLNYLKYSDIYKENMSNG